MKKTYKVLICSGACLTALLLPLAGLEILLPPVIALTGFMAAEWGLSYLMPVLLAGAAGILGSQAGFDNGALFFTPAAHTWCMLGCYAALLASAYVCLKFRLANRITLLSYAAILCIGIYLMLTIGSLLAGEPPYAGAVDYLQHADGGFAEALGSAYTQESRQMMQTIIGSVPDMLMMFTLAAAILLGFETFMFGRLFYRVFKASPRRMAELGRWRLPKSILIGTLITAAVCAAAFILKLSIAPALSYAMGLVFAVMYSVQGMAYITFILTRMRAGTGVRVVTWVLAMLFIPYSMIMLALLGIVEQITKKRDLVEAFERQAAMERRLRRKQDEYEKYGYTREDDPHGGADADDKNENDDNDPKRG